MNIKSFLLMPVVLTIFIIIILLAFPPSTRADPGSPFWSIYVGNSWTYDGSGPEGASWTWLDEITESDSTTIPEVTTYRHDSYLDGWYDGSEWYSISSTEMKLWKEEFFDFETISLIYDGGLVVGKNPIIVGDYWTSETTGTASGTGGIEPWSCPVDVNFEVTVLDYELVTTPLGDYKAYKMRYIYHVWNIDCDIDGAGTYYQWIVPYIGIVKWQSFDELDTEVLSSMTIKKEIVDCDSDAKTDVAVYRSNSGAWFVNPSGGGSPYGMEWGGDASDKPAPGDYDGDGKTDIAVYRSSTGAWFIYPSGSGSSYGVGFGGDASDIPVPFDYDGDAKSDIAIYRIDTGAWFINPSGGGPAYGVGFGGDASDIPVPGDYDGDGMADLAIYRKSTGAWFIYPSSTGSSGIYGLGFGGDASDIPVPGDYDGDGKTDIAVYRRSTGAWFVYPSSIGPSGIYGVGFGEDASDIPVPGDYDGDGTTDLAIYRATIGAWFIYPSSTGPSGIYGVGFGGDVSDLPVVTNPAAYM
jgi:hypothetical protein